MLYLATVCASLTFSPFCIGTCFSLSPCVLRVVVKLPLTRCTPCTGTSSSLCVVSELSLNRYAICVVATLSLICCAPFVVTKLPLTRCTLCVGTPSALCVFAKPSLTRYAFCVVATLSLTRCVIFVVAKFPLTLCTLCVGTPSVLCVTARCVIVVVTSGSTTRSPATSSVTLRARVFSTTDCIDISSSRPSVGFDLSCFILRGV